MSDAIQSQILQSPLLQNQTLQPNEKAAQNLASDFKQASSTPQNEALAPFSDVIDTDANSEETEMMMAAMTSVIEQQLASILNDIVNGTLASELDTATAFNVFSDEDDEV